MLHYALCFSALLFFFHQCPLNPFKKNAAVKLTPAFMVRDIMSINFHCFAGLAIVDKKQKKQDSSNKLVSGLLTDFDPSCIKILWLFNPPVCPPDYQTEGAKDPSVTPWDSELQIMY